MNTQNKRDVEDAVDAIISGVVLFSVNSDNTDAGTDCDLNALIARAGGVEAILRHALLSACAVPLAGTLNARQIAALISDPAAMQELTDSVEMSCARITEQQQRAPLPANVIVLGHHRVGP